MTTMTMTSVKPLEDRLELIAAKMTLRSPFISSVFCTIPKLVTEGGTTATNGEWFKFARSFCNPLSEEELLGLAIQEASHVILGHIWRTDGYEPGLANVAQDAVINPMLLKMGFQLPKGGVFFDWVTPEMDWEEVYARLKKEQDAKPKPKPGQGKGDGQCTKPGKGDAPGDDGEAGDKPGNNPMGLTPRPGRGHDKFGQGGFDGTGDCDPCPSEAKRNQVEATIMAAAKMARECGDGSVLIDRVLGKVGEPVVRWQDETRAMLMSAARDDYSFRRPSRRMLAHGMYIPSLYSEALGGLGIGWDLSGSMSQEDADRIAGELMGLWSDCHPDWLEVVFFADRITKIQRFEKGEDVVLAPHGTGGTRFAPVFEHFEKLAQQERMAGIIFFTDLESNDLMKLREPACPVLWGVVNGDMSTTVPFGHKVKVAL